MTHDIAADVEDEEDRRHIQDAVLREIKRRFREAEEERGRDAVASKLCAVCGGVKPLVEFHRNRARDDGRQTQCIECVLMKAPAQRPKRVSRTPAEQRAIDRESWRARWALEDAYADLMPKTCSRCYEDLPRTSFSKNASSHDGLLQMCRPCSAERTSSRRAMIRGQWVEDVDRILVWDRDNGICYLCGEPANPDKWDLDHVIPIVRGGAHSYANTAVTHPSCNRSKGAKLIGTTPARNQ